LFDDVDPAAIRSNRGSVRNVDSVWGAAFDVVALSMIFWLLHFPPVSIHKFRELALEWITRQYPQSPFPVRSLEKGAGSGFAPAFAWGLSVPVSCLWLEQGPSRRQKLLPSSGTNSLVRSRSR